jgi:hypothetical protein
MKPSVSELYFTSCAMNRLRLLHPRCGITGARSMYEEGDVLSFDEAQEVGIARDGDKDTTYVVDPNGDGVFVVVLSFGGEKPMSKYTCVTYRSFTRQQRSVCWDILDERDRTLQAAKAAA